MFGVTPNFDGATVLFLDDDATHADTDSTERLL